MSSLGPTPREAAGPIPCVNVLAPTSYATLMEYATERRSRTKVILLRNAGHDGDRRRGRIDLVDGVEDRFLIHSGAGTCQRASKRAVAMWAIDSSRRRRSEPAGLVDQVAQRLAG